MPKGVDFTTEVLAPIKEERPGSELPCGGREERPGSELRCGDRCGRKEFEEILVWAIELLCYLSVIIYLLPEASSLCVSGGYFEGYFSC